jgi:hypothetical protein
VTVACRYDGLCVMRVMLMLGDAVLPVVMMVQLT